MAEHDEKKEKDYTIIVNADEATLDHNVVTFDEIVKIAFPNPPSGTDPEFTVSYEHADSKPHDGILSPNGTVTVKKKGTTFDVGHTNRS